MDGYHRRTLQFYSGGWNTKKNQPNSLTITGDFKLIAQASNTIYEGLIEDFPLRLIVYSDMSGKLIGEFSPIPEKICKHNPYKNLKMEQSVSADLPLDETVETSNDFLINGDFNERVYKLWFDFEMTGIHQETTPISLGIVSSTGKEFYAEFTDYDRKQVDPWIQENVIAKTKWLSLEETPWQAMGLMKGEHKTEVAGDRKTVTFYLKEWIKENFQTHYDEEGTLHNRIEFVGDCCAYDWMLLTDLIGEYKQQEWRDGNPILVDINKLPEDFREWTKDRWIEEWNNLKNTAGFMEVRRYKTGLPFYPDGVNYIPTDLCTIFKVRGIDPDINREEYAGVLLKNYDEPEQKHNALWDAKVIKCCYERLQGDEMGNALILVGNQHGYEHVHGNTFRDSSNKEYQLTFTEI